MCVSPYYDTSCPKQIKSHEIVQQGQTSTTKIDRYNLHDLCYYLFKVTQYTVWLLSRNMHVLHLVNSKLLTFNYLNYVRMHLVSKVHYFLKRLK